MTAKELALKILELPEEEQNKEVVLRTKHYSILHPATGIRKSLEAFVTTSGPRKAHNSNVMLPAEDTILERTIKEDGTYTSIPSCYLTNTLPFDNFVVITDE